MIVKVQRNLNEPASKTLLVYSEDRSLFFESPMMQFVSWFKRGEDKFYAEAYIREGKLHLLRKVKPEDW